MEREIENIELRPDEWLLASTEEGEAHAAHAFSEQKVRLWALVLEARYLPCRIVQSDSGWQLLVPAGDLAAAREELRLFEEENQYWPPPSPSAPPLVENTLATLSSLILLATFHNVTRLDMPLFGRPPLDWNALGNAHAARILDGQWWRLVTALTLHADTFHLFSNLAIGGFFIICLCREFGSGLAWCLLLGSGILGNLANACLQLPDHRSVGASTLVFGAVGMLGALSMVRYRHYLQRRRLLPVAAALSLLVLLGTEGKNTDLGAHLFGFAFGMVAGLVAEFLVGRYGRPSKGLNALLALASACLVVSAWWMAVLYGG